MKPAPELLEVARGVVWFQPPEETLADPVLFLAHVMTFGTIEEVGITQKYFTPRDFQRALENAPPGIFDGRSWACWNTVFDRVPIPPMPKRRFLRDEQSGKEG